jgi:uncharacterized protein (DUF488 family)
LNYYQLDDLEGILSMATFGKLYTVGYAALEEIELLQSFLSDRILLIDIRYFPSSRWRPEWSRKRLCERFASNYQHIRELGNVNYHSNNLPIQLVDSEQGISKIVQLLQLGHDICLLCACSDWETCHRRTVVDLVQDEMPDIQPVHLTKDDLYCFS